MTINDKLKKKNYNMILTEKQQKNEHCRKIGRLEQLTGEGILPSEQNNRTSQIYIISTQ